MKIYISILGLAALLAGLGVQGSVLRLGRSSQHHLQSAIFPVLGGGITKVIHQTWKSHKLLPHQAEWRESWRVKHPHWLHKLWTDAENRALIEQSMPWLLSTYDSMPAEIFKADLARYAYMYIYGGVYVDLDFECIKSIDGLLRNKSIALAYDIREDNGGADIANAFLASAPGHPFWIHLLTSIVERAGNSGIIHAITATGPGAITMAYKDFTRVKNLPVYVAPAGMIYPIPDADIKHDPCRYQEAAFNAATCKAKHSDAIAITYWTGTWYGGKRL